ncbi:MAG: hypothetical protein JWO57_4077 [Pseudonocardiales bacterium]|nr:hypothetical protein [Pseudonocardiales bacterium]
MTIDASSDAMNEPREVFERATQANPEAGLRTGAGGAGASPIIRRRFAVRYQARGPPAT